jgi:mannose-6-phosphate isomerase-like protein (cupin superfamily)
MFTDRLEKVMERKEGKKHHDERRPWGKYFNLRKRLDNPGSEALSDSHIRIARKKHLSL